MNTGVNAQDLVLYIILCYYCYYYYYVVIRIVISLDVDMYTSQEYEVA
jgi:hypothetical protein